MDCMGMKKHRTITRFPETTCERSLFLCSIAMREVDEEIFGDSVMARNVLQTIAIATR